MRDLDKRISRWWEVQQVLVSATCIMKHTGMGDEEIGERSGLYAWVWCWWLSHLCGAKVLLCDEVLTMKPLHRAYTFGELPSVFASAFL